MPQHKYFLSFASTSAFLGGVIVEAPTEKLAVKRAAQLKIHPGGEVLAKRLTEKELKRVPAGMQDRLLTEREIRTRLNGRGAYEG